jgi:hypothetical protein
MRNTRYVYECKCGQLTAVDVAAERPLCSKCKEQEFTYVLCFNSDERHTKSNWIKSCLQMQRKTDGSFEPQMDAIAMQIDDVIDRKSTLRLSRARALLDHLEMLRESQQIGDDRLEEEKRRVLQRVVLMVKNSTPVERS